MSGDIVEYSGGLKVLRAPFSSAGKKTKSRLFPSV